MTVKMALMASFALPLLVSAQTGAFAVDTITSRDAPDLSRVRAKIEAKDFKEPWRS